MREFCPTGHPQQYHCNLWMPAAQLSAGRSGIATGRPDKISRESDSNACVAQRLNMSSQRPLEPPASKPSLATMAPARSIMSLAPDKRLGRSLPHRDAVAAQVHDHHDDRDHRSRAATMHAMRAFSLTCESIELPSCLPSCSPAGQQKMQKAHGGASLHDQPYTCDIHGHGPMPSVHVDRVMYTQIGRPIWDFFFPQLFKGAPPIRIRYAHYLLNYS